MSNRTPDEPDRQAGDEFPLGPIGGYLSVVLRGLLVRFRFANLALRHESRWLLSLFSFINGCLSIAIMTTVALISGQPFIFPSLGPTAFLFFYTPLAPPASPRNTIIGHLIGALAGYGSLLIFGLQDVGPALATGVTAERVGAAALSLGLTSGLMVLLKSPHPPAGATTLIISLGILHTLDQIVVLMIAVILLTGQALIINRLAGLPYPLWSAPSAPPANR
ncbi:MAG TPA: HPP family protein [Thermomicrobiales bacterium]|nr:HPP family protein [Thermomicrobiales bacterium]